MMMIDFSTVIFAVVDSELQFQFWIVFLSVFYYCPQFHLVFSFFGILLNCKLQFLNWTINSIIFSFIILKYLFVLCFQKDYLDHYAQNLVKFQGSHHILCIGGPFPLYYFTLKYCFSLSSIIPYFSEKHSTGMFIWHPALSFAGMGSWSLSFMSENQLDVGDSFAIHLQWKADILICQGPFFFLS